MQRIIVVYNAHSTRSSLIESEVFEPLRKLPSTLLSKFPVRQAPVLENAKNLAKVLEDGALVISAGGDGTTSVAVNAIELSKKSVKLALLPYGNFNELSTFFGLKKLSDISSAKIQTVYPIEVKINGKEPLYVLAYLSLGMMCHSVLAFEKPKYREKLRKSSHRTPSSMFALARWYFRHRFDKNLLPKDLLIDGKPLKKSISDIDIVNSTRVASVARTKGWFNSPDNFGFGTFSLRYFPRLASFMLKSIFREVPLQNKKSVTLSLPSPSSLSFQFEGQFETVKDATSLTIQKSPTPLTIITNYTK